jgi:cell wall assembly regulator SMI1
MEETWRRIEAWLAEHVTDGSVTLNPGATEEAIQKAETTMGMRLPEDLRASYLRHNGQPYDANGLLEGYLFQPLEQVVADWKVWKERTEEGAFEGLDGDPEPFIQGDWWNVKWIPVAANGGGDHICVDMAPAHGGYYGQVIAMWHDWERRAYIAGGFQEWLQRIADGLESSAYVYVEDKGILLADEDKRLL